MGSQSLRKAELDSRREVGVIVRDAKVVKGSKEGNTSLSAKDMKLTVAKAVKEAVRERVAEMMNETEEPA